MKFRGDFVTNSSSSSFTAFTIKSKLLADILSAELSRGTVSDDASFWEDITVNGDTVTYKDGGGDITYSNAYEAYVAPENVYQVFQCVNWMIKATSYEDDSWDWDNTTSSSKASQTIAALVEHDPKGAADSIEKCEWSSGDIGRGEFLPWYDGEFTDARAIEIVMKELGYTDQSQLSEKEYNRYVQNAGEWGETKTFTYDKKKGIEEYIFEDRHFMN